MTQKRQQTRNDGEDPGPERARDVVVIGGGPAGSAAAILLAELGHDVLICEALDSPRVHVGESLIPAANRTLARLGMTARMDELSCPQKFGVQFYSQTKAGRPFYFEEASDPELHQTWQVRRSAFDAAMLERAVECGAELRIKTQVRDVELDEAGDRVVAARILGPDGVERRVPARMVLDASGQRGLLAKRFDVREHIDGLRNAAAWAHFDGVQLDEGTDAGSTLIYRVSTSTWFWLIPVPGSVSIGVVMPMDELRDYGRNPVEILDAALEACPMLQMRMKNAKRSTPVRFNRDFSYRATSDGGRGWALVGDALGFMDPVYSSGLFLALHSAELAADRAHALLQVAGGSLDMRGFSGDYQEAFEQFLTIVRAYYSEDFHFGDFARSGDRRKGLVDLFTGDVGTPHAREVARAIREHCKLPERSFPQANAG